MKEIECTSYLLLVSTTDEMVEDYLGQYIPALARTPDILDEYLIPPETDNSNIINDKLFEGNAVVEYVQQ